LFLKQFNLKNAANISSKTIQKFGFKNVPEIIGTTIPSYYDFILKNKMSIYDKLIETSKSNKNDLIRLENIKLDSINSRRIIVYC
jgi:hypothetical protein